MTKVTSQLSVSLDGFAAGPDQTREDPLGRGGGGRARDSVEMAGGTTFHFVTGGIEDALERARAAAGDGDVNVAPVEAEASPRATHVRYRVG